MSQLLSRVGKLLGGLLLLGGGTVSAGLLVGIVASHAGGAAFTVLTILLALFGLAPATLGGGLLFASSRLERQARRDRFFQLLLAQRGRLSLLDFAAATRLEPAIARQQLDSWAKELDASFEVSESGEIYYIFSTELLPMPESNPVQLLGQAMRQWLQSAV